MFNALMLVHNRRPISFGLTATLCLIGSAGTLPAWGQAGEEARTGQEARTGLGFGQGTGRTGEGPLTAQGRQPAEPPMIAEDPIDPNLPIKPSFLIHVSVENETEPSTSYVVDPAGNILLRIAEQQMPVSLKDQTATQAAATLTTFLKKYLKDPKVTVSLVSVPRPIVTVGGCVQFSGPVMINRRTRLVDVLNRSGFSENSDLGQVHLIRTTAVNGADKAQDMILHPDTYMRPETGKPLDVAQNPVLQDNDEIFVPFRTLSGNGGITITGEVLHPTEGMLPRPNMTIREAISIVGGTTTSANRKTVSIKRGSQEIIVDLNKAETNDAANNILLQPGDNIHVEPLPPSAVVNVEGGFIKAGKYPYEAGMTLIKAIMVAGGPSSFAKDKDGIIVRYPVSGDPKKTQIIAFNWQSIKKDGKKDIEIQPGDNIWIGPGNPPQNQAQLQQLITSLAFLGSHF